MTFFGPFLKEFFYYGIGALALIGLADYQPQMVYLFIVILITGVLLTHWQDYVNLFNPPTPTGTTTSTKGA